MSNKKNRKEYHKQWYQKNRERELKHTKEYYQKNKEKIAIRRQKYRQRPEVKKRSSEYMKEYNIRYKEKKNRDQKLYFKTSAGIFSLIRQKLAQEKKKDFLQISREDFVKWYDSQEKKCFYCDIPKNLIYDKWCKQSKKLQIDRMDSNKFYELGNIVLACPVCNSFKSDIFSAEETKEIAQKYIKPRWKRFYS